ncbi:MAG: VTT domain-containing protein [Candidatus Acidiferrales bacterium]|jgi:membrane protein YqaA with SNARE-associated domain
MNKVKLPPWLQHLVATLGGGGLFVVAFLDSSVLSFPVVTDLLVIEESIQNHARMPYYAAMAMLGSLAGCIWLYLIAKKGGEALYRRRSGKWTERIRGWVSKNAFLSAFVPSLLPPPLPFKAFILAEGVFQVPLRTFVLALLLGRGLRYFIEGLLAVRYGDAATAFLLAHGRAAGLATVVVVLALYFIARIFQKHGVE